MSIESVMPSNHLILCCPLLLPPSIFASIRVFSNESALRIRWPKYWSFSFSISPSNEHSGLISFRMDWLDLLAVEGAFKSLLQHHSSKASILRGSASIRFDSVGASCRPTTCEICGLPGRRASCLFVSQSPGPEARPAGGRQDGRAVRALSSTARRTLGNGPPISPSFCPRCSPEGCPTNAGAPLTPAAPHRLEPEEEQEARRARAGQVFRL